MSYLSDLEARLCRFSRASTIDDPDTSSQSSPRCSATSQLALAIQAFEGSCIFTLVPVKKIAGGEEVWTSIKDAVWHASIAHCLGNRTQILFAKTVVGTAKVQQAATCDVGVPGAFLRISIRDFKQDELLTEALNHPKRFSQQDNYVLGYGIHRFTFHATISVNDISDQNVIVIRKILDKGKVAWFLVFLLTIAPALGVTLGLLSHRAEVGIAVGAGIFALASFILGLAAWFDG